LTFYFTAKNLMRRISIVASPSISMDLWILDSIKEDVTANFRSFSTIWFIVLILASTVFVSELEISCADSSMLVFADYRVCLNPPYLFKSFL